MIRLSDLRGIHCRNCGADTRLFSPICGHCLHRKNAVQRLPITLLPVVILLGVMLVTVAGTLAIEGG